MAKKGAGAMDRVTVILSRTLSPNSYGEQIETFTALATVWAEKIELSGQELLLAQQVSAETTLKYRIRWRPDVTATCRLLVDGVTYGIVYIAEVERRERLELTCKAVVA
ncbi:MAG TPA: phage head closure protein [Bradyrhizobium sp.]